MSSPTRRDEAWHAILVTATEVGLDDSFDVDAAGSTADELELGVSDRTIRKALTVMTDLGYLKEIETGEYRIGGDFAADVSEAIKPGTQATLAEAWSS